MASEEVAKATVQQQAALWMFGIIAGASVLFGVLQIRQSLKAPFVSKADTNNNTGVELNNSDLAKLSALKSADTDVDGLSDYDELYTYDTSPYLQDSDSDGIKDKEELQSGGNPNCPEGEICDEPRQNDAAGAPTGSNEGSATTNTNSTSTDSTLATAPVPPATIRQILKNAGAPAEAIDGLNDNELIKLYNETVKATGVSFDSSGNPTNVNGSANGNVQLSGSEQAALLYDDLQGSANPLDELSGTGVSVQQLQTLTPVEIRTLLIKIGGDEKLINSIDDATIKAIFLQAINQFAEAESTSSQGQ